jgi:hypothetical protein
MIFSFCQARVLERQGTKDRHTGASDKTEGSLGTKDLRRAIRRQKIAYNELSSAIRPSPNFHRRITDATFNELSSLMRPSSTKFHRRFDLQRTFMIQRTFIDDSACDELSSPMRPSSTKFHRRFDLQRTFIDDSTNFHRRVDPTNFHRRFGLRRTIIADAPFNEVSSPIRAKLKLQIWQSKTITKVLKIIPRFARDEIV